MNHNHHDHRDPHHLQLLIIGLLTRGADAPEGFVEDLQHKVLLIPAGDAQQVCSVVPAEQVSLNPAPLLLQLGGVKHLYKETKLFADIRYVHIVKKT